MACFEEVSKRLSLWVDCLGYNERMRILRNKTVCLTDSYESSGMETFKFLTAGSRKEGVARCLESDIDILTIPTYILCTEALSAGKSVEKMTVFTMITDLSPPGYCILKLVPHEYFCSHLDSALWQSPDGYYLSSSKFRLGRLSLEEDEGSFARLSRSSVITSMSFKRDWDVFDTDDDYSPSSESTSENLSFEEDEDLLLDLSGPAYTTSMPFEKDMDVVDTIRCICPSVLYQWLTRRRLNDWPPLHVRQRIAEMEGNLVPTGCKGSRYESVEWRLCFNEIEILLVENLNDTQMKLYVMLKMVNNDILKPSGNNITSYLLKNLVFWLAERFQSSMFRSDNLFCWVMKALRLLERSIKLYFLPYYIIPARNLLIEKVAPSECGKLLHDLSDIIQAGPSFLFRLKKLELVMGLTTVELLEFREKRDEYECFELLSDLILFCQNRYTGLRAISARQHELLCNNWPEKVQRCLRGRKLRKYLIS